MDAGRYRHLHLPTRHGGATLPSVAAIDMRATPPERGQFLAPPLIAAIRDTLARGEQAMLFLNRRGYAPLTLCRALRPSHAVPELHRLAGGAPRAPIAAMPPLRPHRCRSPPNARRAVPPIA